jgi:hypothetical protein
MAMAKSTVVEEQKQNTAPKGNNESTIKPNSAIESKLNGEYGLIVESERNLNINRKTTTKRSGMKTKSPWWRDGIGNGISLREYP